MTMRGLMCGVVAMLVGLTGLPVHAGEFSIAVPADPPLVEGKHFRQGSHAAPDGRTLTLNNHFLRLGGEPILPVAGEFHYTRYPRAEWEEAIAKMKSGGIRIIATYCFWNHHQEQQDRIRFDGNLDVRHFITLCARHGLLVFPRIGPWCHGENRYGGFPDWFVKKHGADRNAVWEPGGDYWAHYERWYRAVAEQFAGLYFKDGGPIIGIQVDNEVSAKDPAARGYRYMQALKRLAVACGIDVPLYTATGWGGIVPEDELMPVQGAYPEAPWEGHARELEPSTSFTFTRIRQDPQIGSDLGLGASTREAESAAVTRHPYLTVEMGGGNQVTYHRRPLISAADVLAPVYTRLGMGANSMGYYVYHGTQHPLSSDLAYSTQESRATGYPNDYPTISYDFQAPLTEWGFARDSYHDFRRIHLFLADFGPLLAPMYPTLPAQSPDAADAQTLRYAVRSRGDAGFLFFNNYVRHLRMKDHADVRFVVKLPRERISIPEDGGFCVPNGVYTIMPFNLQLGEARLKYATAHPLCILKNEKTSVFFFAPKGILPEYQFQADTVRELAVQGGEAVESNGAIRVRRMKAGRDCVIRFRDRAGKMIELVTLGDEDARRAYKATLAGMECLLLTDRLLMCTPGDKLELRSLKDNRFELAVYPELQINGTGCSRKGAKDGLFTVYEVGVPAWKEKRPTIVRRTEPEAFATYCAGLGKTPAGPTYGHRFNPQAPNLVYEIRWPDALLDGVNNVLVEFDYVGNTAGLYADGILIADDYYYGRPMPFGAKRHAGKLGAARFLFELTPLMPERNIYFEPGLDLGFAGSTHAELRSIRLTPEYAVVLSAGAANRAGPRAAATNTASLVVLQAGRKLGEKATVHRYERLRAGAIKTESGWNVQDFASSFFNPNPQPITVTMKMVGDDPAFRFANGQVGTYTKVYTIRPMQGETDNIYIGSPAFGKPDWPVAPQTNFTGSVEFSSAKPFYYYFLRQTEAAEAPDATDSYFAAWRTWADDVPSRWDEDLKRFVIPYTNYWHNEKSWPIGWHSVLTLKNNADRPVTCTLKHIPYYGGQFNAKNNQVTRYAEQVVEVVLQKGEERKMTLQDLFGWAADQMSSMEGCLLVDPSPAEAASATTVHLSVIPNESGERLHAAIR